MAYLYLFQLTKPSPLAAAGPGEKWAAAGQALIAAGVVAVCLVPLAVLLDFIGARRSPGTRYGAVAVPALVYGVAALAFVENLSYSTSGVGLKSEDSLLFKVCMVTVAGLLGTVIAYRTARLSARWAGTCLAVVGVAAVPACVLVAREAGTETRPPALVASGAAPAVKNVLILSADGVEASHLSAYGYPRETTPFLDRRIDEFSMFENAFTNNAHTTGSITSLLTGRSPLTTGVVYPPDQLRGPESTMTVPHLLRRAGVVTSNWSLPYYADSRGQNLIDAFDMDNGYRPTESFLERLPLGARAGRWFTLDAFQGTTALVADVLGQGQLTSPFAQVGAVAQDTANDDVRLAAISDQIERDAPFFIHAHFMATHGPVFAVDEPHFSRGDEQKKWFITDFYDDAIRQFDSYVEKVYAELEESGRLDETLLIVTSDHGKRWSAVPRIPLLIRWPNGESSGRWDVNVQRLDIAPTVLDALGFQPPAWLEGQTLRSPAQIPVDRPLRAAETSGRGQVAGQGVHAGRAGDLVVTTFRCREYVRTGSDGVIESGQIEGSTARCDAAPEDPSAD